MKPFQGAAEAVYSLTVERTGQKFKSFKEAEEAERRLHKSMTPDERMRIARELRDRVFPGKQPDVREWHRSLQQKA